MQGDGTVFGADLVLLDCSLDDVGHRLEGGDAPVADQAVWDLAQHGLGDLLPVKHSELCVLAADVDADALLCHFDPR